MTAAVKAAPEGNSELRGQSADRLAKAISATREHAEPVNLRDVAELSKGRVREGVVFRSSQFLRSAYSRLPCCAYAFLPSIADSIGLLAYSPEEIRHLQIEASRVSNASLVHCFQACRKRLETAVTYASMPVAAVGLAYGCSLAARFEPLFG